MSHTRFRFNNVSASTFLMFFIVGLCATPALAATPSSGTTTFGAGGNDIAIVTGTANGAGITATNVRSTGWDVKVITTDATNTSIYAGDLFYGTGDGIYYSATGTFNAVPLGSFSVSANDGSIFDLQSVDYCFTDNDNGIGNVSVTLTGYRSGSPVSGATISQSLAQSQPSISNFNVSANSAFVGIDTFVFTNSSAGEDVGFLCIDNLNVSNVRAALDSDGSLTASATVSEPVGLDTTVDTVGEAVNVFDFTLTDGGASDGLAMTASQVVIHASGTSTDADRAKITWRLNGPDVSNVTGTYNAGSDTITFSGLSISVANGASETYTVNAYYNDNTSLTEDRTIVLSVDGDTDVTVGGSGTQMGSTSAVANGTGTTLDVVATALAFTAQPAGSTSGSALSTQPVVTARDAFGNTDVDFAETVTLTEASAGSLTNNTATASSGVATFSTLTYTASADQESFTLTANDQDGVGSDLPTVNASAVTSDVVATKLIFSTQPAPLSVNSGAATAMTTVPVVSAVDASNTVDTGYSTDMVLSEVNGAGAANISGTGDTDGNSTTVTLTPSSGVVTYTGLNITYTASGGSNENFNLRASSGALTVADSSQFTAVVDVTPPSGYSINIDQGAANASNAGALSFTFASAEVGARFSYSVSSSGGGNITVTNLTVTSATQQVSMNSSTQFLGDGTLTVSVTLTDTAGNVGSAVQDTMTKDTVAPVVSSVSVPANGTYITGQNLTFTVNTDSTMSLDTGGGTPRLAITIGGTTRYAGYDSGAGTSALVFNYTVQSGDTDSDGIALAANLDANGGAVTDGAGNNLTTTLNSVGSLSAVLVDTAVPGGHSVSFDDTAYNASEAGSASFTFASAEVGVSYSYTISSSGGGASATGSGTVSSASQQISGINIGGLSNGTLTLSVVLTDAGGNAASAVTSTASLDTVAPSAPGTPDLATGSDTGSSSTDDITSDTTPTFTGTAEASSTVAISSSVSGALGSTTADGSGNWSFTAGTLSAGSHSITATATDGAGNVSAASSALAITIDATAPSAPGAPDLATGSDTGSSNTDDVTGDTTPTFTGTAEANSTVTLTSSVDGSVGSGTADGSGNWSVTASTLTAGAHSITATASDSAGNASAASSALAMTIDSVVPSAPGAPDLATGSDTGSSSTDDITSDNTPTFTGTAEASSTVTITSSADGVLGTTTADGSGNWSFTAGTLSAGSHNITATATDGAGNVSAASSALAITIDATAPSAPGTPDLATGSDTGSSSTDDITSDTTPTFTGTAEANSAVVLSSSADGTIGSTTADGSGNWSITASALATGSHNITAVITDLAGNVSAASSALAITIDTAGPGAATGALAVNENVANSTVVGTLTSTDAATFALTDSASGRFAIASSTGVVTVADGSQLNFEANASHGITVLTTDLAGNTTSTPMTVTINNVNEAPTVTSTAVTAVNEDALYSYTFTANDVDASTTLTLSVPTLPAWLTFNPGTGALTGTPTNNEVGNHSVTLRVSDGTNDVDQSFTIIVSNTNDLPVVTSTAVTAVNEDSVYSYTFTATDVDAGTTLTLSAPTLPAWLTFTPGTGILTGTPTNDEVGNHSVVLRVNDGAVNVDQSFTITVSNTNDAPVITSTAVTAVNQGSVYTYSFTANDVDAGDTLTLSAPTLPTWLTFTPGTGVLTATPGNSDVGNHNVVLRVNDGTVNVDQSFTIAVANINDAPTITGTPATSVNEDSAYSFVPSGSDVDAGDTITYSIANQPAWASFNTATGELSGTPINDDVGTTTGIVITVTDTGSASTALAAFNLTVVNTNDAPAITGTPDTRIVEGVAYSFTPAASDVDIGDNLTFEIINKPVWASFSSVTGALTGTPGAINIGTTSNVTIGVNDGTTTVNLTAFNLDVVGDLDGDQIGDDVDTDIDGDGMDNDFEADNGLDPRNPDDADADLDGDGVSNLDEYLADSNPAVDDYPPQVTPPADIIVDATGLYTPVTLESAAAVDGLDGTLPATSDAPSRFQPGRTLVTWSATDAAGNEASATQIVDVNPLVSFSKDQRVAEGATARIRVILNGSAATYPVVVPYTVSGTSQAGVDHELLDGSVTINDPGTETSLSFDVYEDNTPEGTETIVVTMGTPTNGVAGSKNNHRIDVIEGNIAPQVTLTAMQDGVVSTTMETAAGSIVVTAGIQDPNSGDTHTVEWVVSSAMTDTDSVDDQFTFDPNLLPAGTYKLRANVSDGQAEASASLTIKLVASLPVLSSDDDTDGDGVDDLAEGNGDTDSDGIPDYLDNIGAANVLPETAAVTNTFLLECDPGVRCGLGQFSMAGSTGGARMQALDLVDLNVPADTDYNYGSGIFDFEMHEISSVGQTVNVVLPQTSAIPADAVYRKFSNGSWKTFVENASNAVSSASGSLGFCPPPGDSSWESGLVEGYYCVQLSIEDGGPNDADGIADASVEDPGGVAVLALAPGDVEQTFPTIRSKSKSSGGATGGILLLMLGALAAAKRLPRGRQLMLALLATSAFTLMPAQSSRATDLENLNLDSVLKNTYLGLSLYQASGSQGKGDFQQGMADNGVSVTLSEYDVSRTAWQFTTGYRYHEYMAFELGYLDLGEATVDMSATGTANNLQAGLDKHYPISGSGWTLANRFQWPVQERVILSAELGFYLWDGDVSLSGADVDPDMEGGTDLLLGIAALYQINDNIGVALQVKRIFFDEQEVDLLGVEGQYAF